MPITQNVGPKNKLKNRKMVLKELDAILAEFPERSYFDRALKWLIKNTADETFDTRKARNLTGQLFLALAHEQMLERSRYREFEKGYAQYLSQAERELKLLRDKNQ